MMKGTAKGSTFFGTLSQKMFLLLLIYLSPFHLATRPDEPLVAISQPFTVPLFQKPFHNYLATSSNGSIIAYLTEPLLKTTSSAFNPDGQNIPPDAVYVTSTLIIQKAFLGSNIMPKTLFSVDVNLAIATPDKSIPRTELDEKLNVNFAALIRSDGPLLASLYVNGFGDTVFLYLRHLNSLLIVHLPDLVVIDHGIWIESLDLRPHITYSQMNLKLPGMSSTEGCCSYASHDASSIQPTWSAYKGIFKEEITKVQFIGDGLFLLLRRRQPGTKAEEELLFEIFKSYHPMWKGSVLDGERVLNASPSGHFLVIQRSKTTKDSSFSLEVALYKTFDVSDKYTSMTESVGVLQKEIKVLLPEMRAWMIPTQGLSLAIILTEDPEEGSFDLFIDDLLVNEDKRPFSDPVEEVIYAISADGTFLAWDGDRLHHIRITPKSFSLVTRDLGSLFDKDDVPLFSPFGQSLIAITKMSEGEGKGERFNLNVVPVILKEDLQLPYEPLHPGIYVPDLTLWYAQLDPEDQLPLPLLDPDYDTTNERLLLVKIAMVPLETGQKVLDWILDTLEKYKWIVGVTVQVGVSFGLMVGIIAVIRRRERQLQKGTTSSRE